MKTYLNVILTGVLVSGLWSICTAQAQTQGSEGTTSTGVSNLTLEVNNVVKITNVSNLDFRTLSPTKYDGVASTISLTDDVCIYSNLDKSVSHTYDVALTGNGTSSSFTVTCSSGDCDNNGTTDEISYLPEWNDDDDDSGLGGPWTVGGATATLSSQSNWSNDLSCDDVGSGNNARYRVTFARNDVLDNRRAGLYTGTLTILITPQP